MQTPNQPSFHSPPSVFLSPLLTPLFFIAAQHFRTWREWLRLETNNFCHMRTTSRQQRTLEQTKCINFFWRESFATKSPWNTPHGSITVPCARSYGAKPLRINLFLPPRIFPHPVKSLTNTTTVPNARKFKKAHLFCKYSLCKLIKGHISLQVEHEVFTVYNMWLKLCRVIEMSGMWTYRETYWCDFSQLIN